MASSSSFAALGAEKRGAEGLGGPPIPPACQRADLALVEGVFEHAHWVIGEAHAQPFHPSDLAGGAKP